MPDSLSLISLSLIPYEVCICNCNTGFVNQTLAYSDGSV